MLTIPLIPEYPMVWQLALNAYLHHQFSIELEFDFSVTQSNAPMPSNGALIGHNHYLWVL